MSVLVVNQLQKNFGSVEVLKDISFSLEQGEVLSIIGSSGSGKTTLLRCLNFLEKPDAGTISVDGKLLLDGAVARRMSDEEIRMNRLHFGLVFQQFNLFPQYTVKQNVTLAEQLLAKERIKKIGSYGGCSDYKEVLAHIGAKADRLLEEVGLSGKKDSYPC